MAAVHRTVHHLRLTAPGETQARRLLPVLEDALRCASLGDEEGSRLLLVRRLALGTVREGVSSQALAQRIEQCMADAARQWVDAESEQAPHAACVAFAGALDARVRLSLRLLRSTPCGAWYWPLAVPEFDVRQGAAATLQRIAWTVAGWPEARVALPAWAGAIVQAGQGAALALAIDERLGAAAVRRAGLPRLGADDHGARVAPVPGAMAIPAWLQALVPPADTPPARSAASGGGAQRRGALADAVPPASTTGPGNRTPAAAALPSPRPAGRRHRAPQAEWLRPHQHNDDGEAHDIALPARAPVPAPMPVPPPWLAPTACGGLLFLLSVLARLGLPGWCTEQAPHCTALVLRAVLRRLDTPAEDAAWQLAACAQDDARPHPAAAPAHWPPRLAQRLPHCRSLAAQAEVWRAATGVWLRCADGLGLAALVQRPARLALTPTHADLFFALDQADLRVRRLGLDVDPGWLPWFGRVVGFHYTRDAP